VSSLSEKAGREGGAGAIVRLTPEAANIEVVTLRGLDEAAAETAIEAALGFGEFARFTGLGTTAGLEQAAKVAQTQGAVDLTAQCLSRLGDLALRRSDHDAARTHYEAALPIYERIPEPYSIGIAHLLLARLDG